MPATAAQISNSAPSYKVLQTLLQSMDASGRQKNSFEELLACLIANLTGERVFVAKSGTQLGNGLNAKATIAIQAKRYQSRVATNQLDRAILPVIKKVAARDSLRAMRLLS